MKVKAKWSEADNEFFCVAKFHHLKHDVLQVDFGHQAPMVVQGQKGLCFDFIGV